MSTPPHYATAVEPLAAMRAWMTAEQYRGFLLGNVVKYAARWQQKDGVADLTKARHYLDLLLGELQQPAAAEPPQPPPPTTEPSNGEVEIECVCPRVRSGEQQYEQCWCSGCRCNDRCCSECECFAEHRRAVAAARTAR